MSWLSNWRIIGQLLMPLPTALNSHLSGFMLRAHTRDPYPLLSCVCVRVCRLSVRVASECVSVPPV